jgi:hypothetical protein
MAVAGLCARWFPTTLAFGLCGLGGLLIPFASAAELVRPAAKVAAQIPDGNATVSGNGADTSRLSMEQREKARQELDLWLNEQARWNKREPRPGEWIDKLPSIPPPIKRIEPPLDTVALYSDAALLERHWPVFLKRHPMTAKQLEIAGILALPKYGAMPGQDFLAFKKKLSKDFTNAFHNNLLDRRRQNVLGILVWTAVYADLLAVRGDESVRCDAGELMRILSHHFFRFCDPCLDKDIHLAPCLAFEVVWPGLVLCPIDDSPQEKTTLAYDINGAIQIGAGLKVPITGPYDWKQIQLAVAKWELKSQISKTNTEWAATALAAGYVVAKDYGRAIQYYHLATRANQESSRNYAGVIKDLLMKKYPKPQAEQQYLAYLKMLSRSELASMGGSKAIMRCRADECKTKEKWEQSIGFLKAIDPYGWDPNIRKEISELEKKHQDKNSDKNKDIRTAEKGKGA